MTDAATKPTLAAFDHWHLSRMTAKQKSDMAAQLIEAGHDRAEVEKVFGPRDVNLTPTPEMIARKERAASLRLHVSDRSAEEKAALENALQQAGLA
jgi:hypothetical protein